MSDDIREKIRRAIQWREGSHVERVHGTPHVGSYTVGQHSYDAAALLLLLHPTVLEDVRSTSGGRLLLAVLLHDLHERYLGDLYGPAKARFRDLAASYEDAAAEVEKDMALPIPALDPAEREWLKAVDVLELHLFAEDQVSGFGNLHCEQIRKRVAHRLAASNPPPEVLEFLARYNWRRTEEDEK
jgi:5'-deoxynucleotidase YfbR-like HD superfamily hydrolase